MTPPNVVYTYEAPSSTDIVRPIPSNGLKSKAGAASDLPPAATYGGGPLIRAAKVFTIFCGSAWNEDLHETQIRLNDFFDFIFTCKGLIKKLKKYSVPGWKITGGEYAGTMVLSDEEVKKQLGNENRNPNANSVNDKIIRKMLDTIPGKAQFRNHNSLYVVYFPPGVTLERDIFIGAEKKTVKKTVVSCKDFCGYHSHIDREIFYAAVPYPDCDNCKNGLDTLSALTLTSSHELWEAITDPIAPQGWYDEQQNEEICDSCEWKTEQIIPYRVQFLPEPPLQAGHRVPTMSRVTRPGISQVPKEENT